MNASPLLSTSPKPLPEEAAILFRLLQVHLLDTPELRERAQQLLAAHHYLGGVQAVGEQVHYAVSDAQGEWVAILIFAAAAKHLRPRDQWIGWSNEQCRRRRALVVNNVRLLLVPGRSVPNLGSVVLSRILARLSDDWQARYDHPVLVVETFVEPEFFQGGVYRASGWTELGRTKGNGRKARDYYEKHDKPKLLFARELVKNARRSLQAEHLKPALAAVEAKVPVRSTLKAAELQPLSDHFRAVPEYRRRMGQYPLYALLGLTACAYLAGAPRGQKDLVAFARRLSSRQRAALGVRRNAAGEYPAPSQPTFSRMFAHVSEQQIEAALLAHQTQVRGAPPPDEIVVLDGKVPKHSGGLNVVSAVTSPGLHYLGSEVVAEKTNEIPAVRALCERLELDGRLVSIDALHTQDETARQIVLAHGGDYLMTVKGNQPTVQAAVQTSVPDPSSPFFAPLKDPAAVRWSDLEKGALVTRTLVARDCDGETAGFPLAAQAARLHRQRAGKKPETVELITSRPKRELSPAQWLHANIAHWGIETGLHARLDASRHDDRCRLRRRKAVRIHGMFNRWANSLFMHWRTRAHHTTTDFTTAMAEDHDQRAVSAVLSRRFPL